MRTIDWPITGGTIVEFLVHRQLSPGVIQPGRASIAQTSAALIDALGIPDFILDYLTDNGLWIRDISQAHQMLSDDATNGVSFRSDLLTVGLPINRQVWTPRTASVPAIDITPKGASPVPIAGRLGWHEFCSSDFLGAANGDPFHSMRLAVLDDGGLIGTFNFNGQTGARPLSFVVGGVTVGTLSDPGGTLYTKGGGKSGTYTIADDAAVAIPVPVSGDPKWAILAIQRNAPGPRGFLSIKAGTGNLDPVEIAMIAGSIPLDYRTGVLAGTTGGAGTDGKLSFSTHTDGNFYIQNRAGGPVSIGTYWMPQA